jgi:hypothetical protein
MTTSTEVRDRIIAMLRRDLIGPLPPSADGDPDADLQRERLGEPPAGWYLTGFIGPMGEALRQDGAADDPDAAEERETAGGDMIDDEAEPREDDDTGAVAQDDEPPEAPMVKRRFVPASIGITVMLPDAVEAIDVRVTWGDYTTEPPLSPEQIAEGVEEELPRLEWLRQPREAVVPLPVPEPGERGERAVPASAAPMMPGGGLMLQAHARRYDVGEPGGPTGTVKVVSVFLVNRRPTARKRVADVTYAFQARLEITCDAGFVARQDTSGYDTDDPDRRLADLHYRDIAEYAVGRNVSGAWLADDDGVVRRVWTDPLPVAAVERVAANDDPALNDAVTFEMEALARAAETGGADIHSALEALPALYGAWIATQDALTSCLAQRRAETARHLIEDMEDARARIKSGIQRLRDEPRARLAFQIANLSIAAALRRRAAGAAGDPAAQRAPAWRPFQLAYILLTLDGIAEKAHPDRELVDLLFFPTGGGKTEAYLGLAAFTIAYRRLLGSGVLGAGVSVIMRYTLRLLTLDQLGRAAGMICALELLRDDPRFVDANGQKLLGDWPIEIGLWVGSDASPNILGGTKRTGDHTAVTRVRRFKKSGKDAPAPIKSCPWCGTEFNQRTFDCWPNSAAPSRMTIRCTNTACDFTRERSLPILAVDEEIYRRLPAFVIATVDKFAGLPWLGEAGAFFGHVDRHDDQGFYAAAQPTGGRPLDNLHKLDAPDLIIQDELHLISGPLGTVAGLYETAIDKLASREVRGQRIRPKIVASTATVRRAEAQIKALLDRAETRIFPPPGVDRRDSWFARTLPANESPPRLYLGLAAQGRGPKFVFLRGLRSVMAAAWAEFMAAGGYGNPDNPADPYVTALCYFNALRELGGARRIVEDEVTTQLAGYAESRKRIDPTGQVFHDRKVREPLELTSRVSTDEVAVAKRRLEQLFLDGAGDLVDVALATNMISVGLDITRLGLMMVQGQPKAAAEYIQATSRVGRDQRKPGLVITALNLHKPRDRGHYESFTTFHESFYRAVEATSVTPWAARALDRSLAAVVVTIARHLRPELSPEGAAAKIGELPELADAVMETLVARAPAAAIAGGEAALRQAVEAVLQVWRDRATLHGKTLAYGGRKLKAKKFLLFQPLDPLTPDSSSSEQAIEAARSMRDVEANVMLKLRDPSGNRFKAEDVA